MGFLGGWPAAVSPAPELVVERCEVVWAVASIENSECDDVEVVPSLLQLLSASAQSSTHPAQRIDEPDRDHLTGSREEGCDKATHL